MVESALIIDMQQGSEPAFKAMVQKYQYLVYNTVLGIVQHEQEAEDLAQDVFVQVYLNIGGFRADAKLSTWIYRIAISKALDWERKKKTRKRFGKLLSFFGAAESSEFQLPDFCHPGILLEKKEQAAILFKALQQLPENQRVAFVLIKTEGLSYAEVSAIMQTSIKAVEAYMQRAKINLKKILVE